MSLDARRDPPYANDARLDGLYCGHMINTLASEPYPPTTILTQYRIIVIRGIGHEI